MKCTFSRNNDTVSRPRGLFSHLSWTFFRRGTNVCRVSWEHGSKIISSGRGFNELSSVTLSNAIYRFIMTAVGTYNVLTSFCELIRNLRLYFEDDGCFSGNFISPRIFLSSRKKCIYQFSLRRLVSEKFLRRVFPPKIYFLLCPISHLRFSGKISICHWTLLPSFLRFSEFSGTWMFFRNFLHFHDFIFKQFIFFFSSKQFFGEARNSVLSFRHAK